jgi:hypothetical protein
MKIGDNYIFCIEITDDKYIICVIMSDGGMYDLAARFSGGETSASETEEVAGVGAFVSSGKVAVRGGGANAKQGGGAVNGSANAKQDGKQEDKGDANGGANGGAKDGATRYASTTYTSEQIADKLIGYIAVPANLWGKIPKGAHVRYIRKDGAFRTGGFVNSNTLKEGGKRVLHLKTSFDGNGVSFPIDLSEVATIHKKISPTILIEIEMIKQMLATHNDEIKALKAENIKLMKVLQALSRR